MKKLLKSYKFWTAFAGSVGVLLMALSDAIGITINVNGVKETIMALCGVLVVFGVVKKPKSTDGEESQVDTENIESTDEIEND